MRQKLQLNVIYCPRFSGEHGGEATRSHTKSQEGNSEDLARMCSYHAGFLNTASRDQLRIELAASVAEADALRSLEAHHSNERQETSAILNQLKQPETTKAISNNQWEDQPIPCNLHAKAQTKLKQAERGA